MIFKDDIELTCQNEEMAQAVCAQIESLRLYCIDDTIYPEIDDDKLTMSGYVKGSNIYIEVSRPDYAGLFDPNFFDGSLEALCEYLDKKVPDAILSGRREYNNPDIYRTLQELLSRKNGKFSTMNVVEIDWKEINQLMEDGVDIYEVCSMLDMDEDEIWDGLSSLESD